MQCLMVEEENGGYRRLAEAQTEDWDEVLDAIEGEPALIGRINGWDPYTHAYRLPNGAVYLVAQEEA